MYPIKNNKTMLSEKLKKKIIEYPDFPNKGILFRDVSPILKDPNLLDELINEISSYPPLKSTDGIVAIDARGFIFGSLLALKLKKPLIIARKRNKLPGKVIEKNYELEYGIDSLSIQESALVGLNNFVIVDDLLATGGTANCVGEILIGAGKKILSLVVIVELLSLSGRKNLKFPVYSQVSYI